MMSIWKKNNIELKHAELGNTTCDKKLNNLEKDYAGLSRFKTCLNFL